MAYRYISPATRQKRDPYAAMRPATASTPASNTTSTAIPNVAASTWTPQNLQGFANAYSGLNPTWTPPAADNAALPNPISPVKFDPYGDVSYAAGASAVINANTHAQGHHDYNVGSGEQNFGYDANGNLITSGANYNPYSQAAVLQRNYDNTKRGTTNSYAANGQLYSGALLNKQADDTYNYNVGDNALKRGASDYYHNNDYSLTQTQDAGQMTLAQLLGPAFGNFLTGQKGY